MKRLIAWSMTLGRVLFAPLVVWLALHGITGWRISLCIVAEVILDIFDGIVARRLQVATSLLRRMDSLVDTIFYLAVLYCAWALHSDELRKRWWLLAALLFLEALRYAFDYLKFRREAAYHMWSAKAWGLVLGTAVIALLGFNVAGWLLTLALIAGIVCDCEGLLISALLYESIEDVPHVFRAVRLRQEQKAYREIRKLAASSN